MTPLLFEFDTSGSSYVKKAVIRDETEPVPGFKSASEQGFHFRHFSAFQAFLALMIVITQSWVHPCLEALDGD